MKKSLFMTSAVMLAFLASCGGGGGTSPKTITPNSTEFASGELARYIEVGEEPAELTYSEQKGGMFDQQYIRLSVPVKMIQEGFQGVDPRDIGFTRLLSVATIDLLDENGNKVTDINVKHDDILKLKKLLTSGEGTIETIVFEGEYGNPEAAKWFESVVSYKPNLTADIQIDNQEDNNSSDSVSDDNDNEETSVAGPAETVEASSSSDAEFDEFLASYEEYINEYIKIMKKASNGDYSAMADAQGMMQKAQEYATKLTKISSQLTPAQLQKFQKLQQKLIQAAQQ